MRTTRQMALCMILLVAPAVSVSAIELTKTSDVLVDAEALMIRGGINGLSFQQDALISHQGYQYVGYYDGKRRVCLARRKQSEESWQVIRFEDYRFTSVDSHNTISVGICPKDGTIHLAFDHHGHPLHYRVSLKRVASQPEKAKWTASLFGRVVSELERGKPITLTYPRFWQTPQGGLQFCYRVRRAGDGDRVLVDYSPKTGNWGGTRQIDSGAGTFKDHWGQSPSRCSYPNGYCFGPDGNLHVTWVWREGKGNANHDLMYSYSEDNGRTWLNNKGEKLSIPHVGSPDITVATIPRGLGLINTGGQAVDSKGRVHAVMWHCSKETLAAEGQQPSKGYGFGPPRARRYHHYWRDVDGKWHHRELPWMAGNRPKVLTDRNDNALLIWGAAQPDAKWFGSGWFRHADLKIAVATAKSGYTDWRIVHVERGPFANEMLADTHRWQRDGTLSVMVQETADHHVPSRLRIVEFRIRK